METNYEVLEQFKEQNKAFEVLMNKFDLSIEKVGDYQPISTKKNIQKKSFYSKPSH